jgi:hypothetical protein
MPLGLISLSYSENPKAKVIAEKASVPFSYLLLSEERKDSRLIALEKFQRPEQRPIFS